MQQQIENRNSSWKSTTPPTLGEKKFPYFGPQTKKLLSWINLHPNGFFEDYILALRGCCALKVLHALKTDQALLAHAPKWDGVPPKKIWLRKFKICPKIQRFKVNNFQASGSIFTGLSSVDVPRSRGDNVGTIFTRPAPINLWRPKDVHNLPRFLTTFDFDHEYLRNGSTYRKSEEMLKIYNPSHVVLWSTNKKVIDLNIFTP